jgi:hypothetical protein
MHTDTFSVPLTFTFDDATDLHAIFLELVSELFVVPAAAARGKRALIERRKIVAKH